MSVKRKDEIGILSQELDKMLIKLEETNLELERLTLVDGLTGIANRRHFDEVLAAEWKRMKRENKPCSLIILDIDYFKKYNDTYDGVS